MLVVVIGAPNFIIKDREELLRSYSEIFLLSDLYSVLKNVSLTLEKLVILQKPFTLVGCGGFEGASEEILRRKCAKS